LGFGWKRIGSQYTTAILLGRVVAVDADRWREDELRKDEPVEVLVIDAAAGWQASSG